jgi:predicted site-specific integrase-resolvase
MQTKNVEVVDPLWRRSDVAKLFSVDVSTVRRWEREGGKLPAPACVIEKRAYWRPEDIRASFNAKSGA